MPFNQPSQPYYTYPTQSLNTTYPSYLSMPQYIVPQPYMTPNQSINQQPITQQQIQNQSLPQDNTIPCEYVDNLEVVNAKNCDFTGKPLLYMKTDGSEIYRKQLDIKTGKSTTYLYKLQEDSCQNETIDVKGINSQIESLRNEFNQNIIDLKELVMNINTRTNNSANSIKKTNSNS